MDFENLTMEEKVEYVKKEIAMFADNEYTPISIHVHDKHSVIRESIVLRNFELDSESVYIEGDTYVLNEDDVEDILLLEEEGEDNICLVCNEKKIYIDLF